jgi:hypothetical protein
MFRRFDIENIDSHHRHSLAGDILFGGLTVLLANCR